MTPFLECRRKSNFSVKGTQKGEDYLNGPRANGGPGNIKAALAQMESVPGHVRFGLQFGWTSSGNY